MNAPAQIETGVRRAEPPRPRQPDGGPRTRSGTGVRRRAGRPLARLVRRAAKLLDASGAAIAIDGIQGRRIIAGTGLFRSGMARADGATWASGDRCDERSMTTGRDRRMAGDAYALIPELRDPDRTLKVPIGAGAALIVVAGEGRRPFSENDALIAAALVGRPLPMLENAVLRHQLRERDAALGRLRAELDKAVGARQRFFAACSHELRTPLNAILCYNDLLAAEVLGPLNERQRNAVMRMASAIVRLRQLIEGALELSELESIGARILAAPTDLVPLAESVVRELKPVAGRRGLTFTVDAGDDEAGVRIVTDAVKVRRILLSLGRISLNLTERGGVTVRVRTVADGARIDVIDTGPGMSDCERDRAFEAFARLTPTQPRGDLDLAIARALARLMSGRLVVEPCAVSGSGTGTAFTLYLPVAVRVET